MLGARGQLGFELCRACQALGEVIPAARPPVPGHGLGVDLADPASVDAFLARLELEAPDFVLNAAAYTAVDRAESEPELAHRVNAEIPGRLAERAEGWGGTVLHWSTDYVFDGEADRPYRETDPPGPRSVYGRTKLAGEEAVLAASARSLVLRSSWLHGTRGSNFVRTMRRLATERDRVSVVDDQRGSPTWARALAEAGAAILAQAVAGGPGWLATRAGTYHVAAAGECSWFELAQRILADTPVRVEPTTTAAWGAAAPRPAYSVLDCTRLRDTFGLVLPDWRRQVDLVLEELEGSAGCEGSRAGEGAAAPGGGRPAQRRRRRRGPLEGGG